MEGTLSEINNQFCWQVNKGVLRTDQQYRHVRATASSKPTSCPERQSCVHKIEIITDKTALVANVMKVVTVNGLNNIEKIQTGKGQLIWLSFEIRSLNGSFVLNGFTRAF